MLRVGSWWLGWVMRWRLTVNSSGDGTSSREYLWPAEAWGAYDATITALEADGFVRRGVESVCYGVSAMQRLVRDSSEVTMKIERTDVPRPYCKRSVVRCEGGRGVTGGGIVQVTYIGAFQTYGLQPSPQATIGKVKVSPPPDREWKQTWNRLAAKYGDEAPVVNADLIEIRPTLDVDAAVRHALELIVQTNDAVGNST